MNLDVTAKELGITEEEDLSIPVRMFLEWMLVDPERGVIRFNSDPSIKAVADLLRKSIEGGTVPPEDWSSASQKCIWIMVNLLATNDQKHSSASLALYAAAWAAEVNAGDVEPEECFAAACINSCKAAALYEVEIQKAKLSGFIKDHHQ
jgi:hypothetical protein